MIIPGVPVFKDFTSSSYRNYSLPEILAQYLANLRMRSSVKIL